MEDHTLFLPLLSTTTNTATTSTSSSTTAISAAISTTASGDNKDVDFIKHCSSSAADIILRLLFVISVGIISLWASHEASKGFDITIINDAGDSPAGKRFNLFYVSNDEATRIIQNTSSFVETLLYDPKTNHTKKQVHRVTLRLAADRLADMVTVKTIRNNEYVMSISPTILELDGNKNRDHATVSTVLRGMARIWLWGGDSRAPPWLLDGMEEYITRLAGFSSPTRSNGGWELPGSGNFCWGDEDPTVVAEFLYYCEKQKRGFIQRLNQGLKDQWHDRTVEDALGVPVKPPCDVYKNSSKTSV